MKNIYVPISVCAIFLASCAENNQDQAGPAGPTQNSYVYPASLNQQQQNNSNQFTTNGTINMQPVATNENSNGTLATNVKLNPPHGQPGHRCDIAVGAPLDGSVQPMNNGQPSQTLTVNPQSNTNTQDISNLKINPAHGQPGHRCDIAVGAPLDGSQKTNNSTVQTTQPVTANQTNTNSNLKINPAHGQPGHRCDIAVGAPLDGSQKTSKSTVQSTQSVNANQTNTNSNLKINPAHGQPGHRCDIAVGAPIDGSTTPKTAVQTTDAKSPLQYFLPNTKIDTSKN